MVRFPILLFLFLGYTSCAQQLSILFNTGEAKLSSENRKRLDSLVYTFETELNYHIKLIGHTDTVGRLKGNQLLSEKRAMAVRKYLLQKRNTLSFDICGKAYLLPVQSNGTERGKARNRRCDIYITPVKTKPASWEMPVQSFQIRNKTKNILYTKHGCKVIIEPGSFDVNQNDSIQIRITEYNDPVDFLGGGLPMSYSAQGRTYMYQSEQMMKIEALIDTVPVKLLKLIGLECPNVDTSNGVRFYEFRGKEISWIKTKESLVAGKVEEVQLKDGLSQKDLSENAGDANKKNDKVKADDIEPEVTKKDEHKQPEDKINIEPDTSSAFELEPDTGKAFILKADFSRKFAFYSDDIADFCFPGICTEDLCDEDFIMSQAHSWLQLNKRLSELPNDIDPRSYYSRYKSLAYDGMQLKCNKLPEAIFSVKTNFKKRFLHKDVILTFISAKENPEYEAIKNIKWIIHYGSRKQQAEALYNIKVSDFRIIRFDKPDHIVYPHQKYFVELKSDSSFYRFAVKPKKPGKTRSAYMEYEKLYKDRVTGFDDSIHTYFRKHNIKDFFCLYLMTEALSTSKKIRLACREALVGPCYPFAFFTESKLNLTTPNDCLLPDSSSCSHLTFSEWIQYYKQNTDVLEHELQGLIRRRDDILKCACKRERNEEREDPCAKWEHTDPNVLGNKIIFIGLSIYNFDREMALEKKQQINDAIYLNEKGDTLLKCHLMSSKDRQKKVCIHDAFTIIPGFNGLLKQPHTEILTLLPGKENILLFSKYNRRYKLYLDLRGKDECKQKVFILKDITDTSESMDGLRQELMKAE